MKKLLIAVLLVILPSACFAQTTTAETIAVGTCQKIDSSGYWQKLSDFSWATPSDKLNTCSANGFAINASLGNGLLNQYNQNLGQMTAAQWYANCVAGGIVLPLVQCQGYNPNMSGFNNQFGTANGLLAYPQMGRDFLSITNANSSVNVDLSNSSNKWRDALIGVGMGWLLNRLTS